MTKADQYAGARTGLAAQTTYAFLAKYGYSETKFGVYFHDIVKGCNARDSSGYCAKKAYDQATGIGSIRWYHYIEQ